MAYFDEVLESKKCEIVYYYDTINYISSYVSGKSNY